MIPTQSLAVRDHRSGRLVAAARGRRDLGGHGTGRSDRACALLDCASRSRSAPRYRPSTRPCASATGSPPCTGKQLDKLWAEDRDEAYELFFGVGASFDDMLAQASISSEERGNLAEPSRFGTLARRVFQPLLSVEDLR